MSKSPILIGVAGGSGSGKTTVAKSLVERITPSCVPIIGHDNYYHDLQHLTLEERMQVNFDHPDSLDNDLLLEQLKQLLAGEAVDMPLYNYATHTRREETLRIEPSRVIMLEGLLILSDPRLRELMDIKLFVDIDADIRFIRRLNRDVRERGRSLESVVDQYVNVVRPMHMEFVEPSKRYADIIIPVGGRNQIAIDMITAKIKAIMEG